LPDLPRISVVTPSFNQGRFIAQTIESVRAQDYPALEHIVVDGGSTDDTLTVLRRYPHLRVICEPDRGPADAINKGLRLAGGDVLCFLNSDDTFLPGALHRVAAEIGRDSPVVVGRCCYVDELGAPLGVEHPWAPDAGHRRVLEVWKGNCAPQPATFWTAEAWRRCGPLDEGEDLVFDYDLLCRFSSRYPLRPVDQVLATYRLHCHSKTSTSAQRETLRRSVRVSRRHWGSPARPLYWRLRLSLARATLLAPVRVTAKRWLRRLGLFRRHSPLTLAWARFTGAHADGAVGPVFSSRVQVGPGQSHLVLRGAAVLEGRLPADVYLEVDGRPVAGRRLDEGRTFTVTAALEGVGPGPHEVTVRSGPWLVPHEHLGNKDFRPLAFRLEALSAR
jgi:glycosyltransferase involved in cell wall biosynthesis